MVNQLTKGDVLWRCRRWGVTGPQLDRWKRQGLLSAPTLHGQGKSQGIRRLWAEDTPTRAILIARTSKDDNEHRRKPSLKRAARVLVGAGYAPDGEVLRELMREQLRCREKELWKHRGHFRELSAEKARGRLDDSVERRFSNLAPDVQLFLKGTEAGFAGVVDETSLLGRMMQDLDVDSLQSKIENAQAESLQKVVGEFTAASREPKFCRGMFGVAGVIGFLSEPAGEEISAALAAPMQVASAEPEKVPIGICELSGELILGLSALWLAAQDLMSTSLPKELLEIAVTGSGSEDPGVLLASTVGRVMGLRAEDTRPGETEQGPK